MIKIYKKIGSICAFKVHECNNMNEARKYLKTKMDNNEEIQDLFIETHNRSGFSRRLFEEDYI